MTKPKTPIQDHAQALHALCEAFCTADDPNQSEPEAFKDVYDFMVEYVRIAQGFNEAKKAVDLIRHTTADPVPSDPHQVIVYGVLQRCIRGDYDGAAKYFHEVAPQLDDDNARNKGASFTSVCLTAIASRARPGRKLPHVAPMEIWMEEDPNITPNQIIERFYSDGGAAAGFKADQIKGTITAPDGTVLKFRNVKDHMYEIRKRLKRQPD
jgi:hypothetical protein